MDIRPCPMDAPVDREAGRIEQLPVARPPAVEDVAVVVDQEQVGRLHLVERDAVGVHPECVRVERVAHGYVAGHAFVVPQPREDAEGAGEALFEMFALALARARRGWRRGPRGAERGSRAREGEGE